MRNPIVIVDYGMGNIFSVRKVVERIGHPCLVSSSPSVIEKAERLILPGVGHFGKAMDNLAGLGLINVLHDTVLSRKVPVLGICLGMQLMASCSEEGDAAGLAWFDARVVRFRIQNTAMFKVPHVGWNTLAHTKSSRLLYGVDTADEFYFVHSYHFETHVLEDVVTTSPYEYTFVSAMEKDNIFGVQFHPEKSHKAGETMIRNFLNAV